jgi:hypothetical protein
MSGFLDELAGELPAWALPNEDSAVGVDYLGTRQANLDMLRELTGVYNNQVRSARQHAILAWAAWRFAQNVKGREEVRPSEFIAFLEMVETIQLVGQNEIAEEVDGARGGLGSGSFAALPPTGAVPVRFSDYRRTRQTSALAAVQYGPSARTAGLGFLSDFGNISVATAGRGEALAQALDGLLRHSSHYGVLTRYPTPATLPRTAVVDLARNGLVIPGRGGAPRPERTPYVEALFRLDGRGAGDRRTETLALFLYKLDNVGGGDGAGEHDLRSHILSWRPEVAPVPAPLHSTALRWQVFETRQLQRFALESWLALAERWMYDGISSVVGMLAEVDRALTGDADMGELLGAPAGAATAGWPDPLKWASDLTPWEEVWDEITPGLRQGDTPAVVRATLRLTLGTMALANLLQPHAGDELVSFYATGGRTRLSLAEQLRWWGRRARWSLREVIGELLEEQVLQQHVGVAVSRFDNDRRRLRFSPGEEGWTLLPGTVPSTPGLTPDRIGAALALLEDVDLVRSLDGERYEPAYKVTARGRKVLERVLTAGVGAAET